MPSFLKAASVLLMLVSSFVLGDEIAINGNSKLGVGDFQCSYCPNSNLSVLNLTSGQTAGTITTGELWRFFNEQGSTSLRSLTLCLDVDNVDEVENIRLSSVKLKIEDPEQPGKYLTSVSFGDNSLLVRGYETTAFKPEAKLEVELGYDFMTKFSGESNEKLFVDFETGDGVTKSANPVLLIQSNASSFFFSSGNAVLLLMFSAFWILVFNLMNRFTKTKDAQPERAANTIISKPVSAHLTNNTKQQSNSLVSQ